MTEAAREAVGALYLSLEEEVGAWEAGDYGRLEDQSASVQSWHKDAKEALAAAERLGLKL